MLGTGALQTRGSASKCRRGQRQRAGWLALFCVVVALSSAAHAATPVAPAAPKPATQPAPVSVDELQRLVDTLQDGTERARLVNELRALIAAQRHTEPKKPEGMELLGRLSRQIDAFTGDILTGAAIVIDAPRLIRWAREQVYDPAARQRWIDAATAFVLVFGAAGVAEWALRWIIARARPKFPVRRRDTRAVRALVRPAGVGLRPGAVAGVRRDRLWRGGDGARPAGPHADHALGAGGGDDRSASDFVPGQGRAAPGR